MQPEELDVTKLRYVLYARKSTEDETRQVRSVPDQISECKRTAEYLGIRIAKTLTETRSAKRPNKRPIFTQMLKDIKNKKYDAVLSWHPDRLARNMKEGGEVIDMIDAGQIKDMKFVTHHFTPDANGKMLLGMAFVLSKQYSDKLSQDVTRGVRKGLVEGKSSGTPKQGYVRNEDGIYRPDGKNFNLVCEAWQLWHAGEQSQEAISDYMNRNGYYRTVKKTGKKLKMRKQTLSEMFKDPFYYGILVQKGQPVDLRDIYNFEPATSEEVYNDIQQRAHRRRTPLHTSRGAFYPLRGMVLCAICDSTMVVAPSKGSTSRYLYYRCDNKLCTRKKRSIRGKAIFDFIYELLKNGLNFTEKEYEQYQNDIRGNAEKERNQLAVTLHNRQATLKKTKAELRERSLKIMDYEDRPAIWKVNNERILELEREQEDVEQEISEIKHQMTTPEEAELPVEQFLNLSKNAAAKVEAGDAVAKDAICRIIFLNLKVDEEKVTSYLCKEPFATLLKTHSDNSGRGGGI